MVCLGGDFDWLCLDVAAETEALRSMNGLLDIICGIAWSIAYVISIFRGFRRKTWCIPGLSICMNFAWELSVVIERISNGTADRQAFVIQFVWLILDFGIITTWLIYDKAGKCRFKRNLIQFITVFIAVYFIARVAGQWKFSVFLINVLMSGDFIARLKKDHSPWTSHLVAITKLIGTLAATVLNGFIYFDTIVLWLGGICFLLDAYYLFLLFKLKKECFLWINNS